MQTAVSESAFLIIFVSKHYLDSKWCFKELEAFRNNFHGGIQETLRHLFILVIDRIDPSHAQWPGWMRDAKRVELFDDSEEHPVGYPVDSNKAPDAELNTQLNRIAERMIDVAATDNAQQRSQLPEKPALNFILGAVTDDLAGTREKVKQQLESEGKHVRSTRDERAGSS